MTTRLVAAFIEGGDEAVAVQRLSNAALLKEFEAKRDGIEALEIARTNRPDLILMDIQLPEVSGLEVTKWIKEDDNLRSIPVVAVTAFAMKGDEEKIREGGCEAYISKPISVTQFLETVQRFLR